MNKVIVAAVMGVVLACQAVMGASLYVAPNGNDGNPGTEDRPFATIERARDEVRQIKVDAKKFAGGVTVVVRGGTYELARPVELGAEDSGTAEAPVVYRAKEGEEVRVVGGKVVTTWKPVTDAEVLNRLEPAARGKVVRADLKSLGIAEFGEMSGGFGLGGSPGTELFFQDRPMVVARYPNNGFIRMGEVLGQTEVNVRGTKGCKEGKFVSEDARVAKWAKEKDARVLGYWFWDWAEQRQVIESIDPEKRIVTLKPPYHSFGYRKGQWFYGFNILAELDMPGEWYLDREKGVVYFWPPAAIEAGKAVVSVLPALVKMKDVSYVTLRGFVFEGARGVGVSIAGGMKNVIAGCTLRNLGQTAITVSGTEHRVVGCDIYGTGDGGIALNGGERKTLTPGGLVAENNHIHDYSRWNRMYRPGINLSGVGNIARHNLIDNAPHIAINFSGNEHVIEFNEIHSVCYESNDAGAIYCGRNWSMRGNVIRHNYLHDVYGHEGKGCVGVYLDDQFSSANIFGNVFYRVPNAAFIGGGRDSTIENNVFVECTPAIHVDARGLGWAAPGEEGLVKGLKAMPYQEEPWKSRYPQLAGLLDDPGRMAPKGNLIARNIQWKGKWDGIEKKAYPYLTFTGNLLDLDPKFIDEKAMDFRLKEDSPAFLVGFKAIPVEKIGLYRDELRASWPVEKKVRPAPVAKKK